VGDKTTWVSFGGPQNSFVTSDEEVQKEIEESKWFKGGQIGVAGVVKSAVAVKSLTPKAPAKTSEPVVPSAPKTSEPPTADAPEGNSTGSATGESPENLNSGGSESHTEQGDGAPETQNGDEDPVDDGGTPIEEASQDFGNENDEASSADAGAPEDVEAQGEPSPEMAVFPDVVDINGASAVLRAEPYKVNHLALRTPEQVRARATINGVSFPNWTE
jgi:hypothetical protein